MHLQGTYSCGKRELEVVRAKCVIFNRRVDHFIQQRLVSKEILGDPQPYPEKLMVGNNQK